MKEIKPELETFARIKVVGVGGSGNHAISRMVEANLKGIDFIAVNADAQDLHHCKVVEKIHIGKNLTRGLGAGMNPDIGRQAAEENRDEIQEALKNADMVFVTCGLGGGTGTGAAPIIAQAAKDAGALTVAVVTRPFAFEGMQRKRIAEAGLAALRENVDTIITIPNDKILQVIDKKTPLLDSFRIVDDVLRQGVQGISDLITIPGIVNVDFADVKAIMQNTGPALMGIGRASGENRAVDAAKQAINSPLLELSIHGARGVLFNISGGLDLSMMEVNDAAQIITESVDPDAKVIFGAITDEDLKKGEIKITVIATGFQALEPLREREFEKILDEVEKISAFTVRETEVTPREDVFRPKEPIVAPKPEASSFSKKNLSSSIADVFRKDLKEKDKEKEEEKEKEPVKEIMVEKVERREEARAEKKEEDQSCSNEPSPFSNTARENPTANSFEKKESEVSRNFQSQTPVQRSYTNPTPNPTISRREENTQKPFSSKISNIKYNDEYDIPAFLRKKMDKNKKESN
jgi:cell division protein FtsZ